MSKQTELTGRKFGSWTVVRLAGTNQHHQKMWTCKCDCGVVRDVVGYTLVTGGSSNCGKSGEHPYKHGDCIDGKVTPEYATWNKMIQRCENKKSSAYRNYGGRGITVCERWHDFQNFIDDVGRKPSKEHSLDRMNNAKGYERSNCRWATREEQMRNTRRNRIVAYKRVTKTLIEWAEDVGISYATLWQRLEVLGWSVERALEEPVHRKRIHEQFVPPALKKMTGKKKVRQYKRTTV